MLRAPAAANHGRTIMMRCDARIRCFIIVASAILTMIVGNPALAQKLGPDGAPNPTASTMTEQQLLQQSPRIEGNIDQPIERARVLIQPPRPPCPYFHHIPFPWLPPI